MKKIVLSVLAIALTSVVWAKGNDTIDYELTKKGLFVEVGVGGGMSGLGYNTLPTMCNSTEHINNQFVSPSWNANVGLTYFFMNWLGVGTGLHFSTYSSTAEFKDKWVFDGLYDYQNDVYRYTVTPVGVKERQDMYMLEVPVALRFKAMPRKVGFNAVLGVKFAFPVYNSSRLLSGELDNMVEYDFWNLTEAQGSALRNIPTVVMNQTLDASTENRLTKDELSAVNYVGYAELGLMWKVAKMVNMNLSVYANYYINDVTRNITRQPIGFSEYYQGYEYPSPFLTAEGGELTYQGVLRSNEVKSVHPWSIGVKIGVDINVLPMEGKKAKEAKEHKADTVWLTKTIHIVDTVVRVDTVRIVEQKVVEHIVVQEKLDSMLSRSVIYFNLDDTTPILKPTDVLDKVADVLRAHPDEKVYINGHACKLGSMVYNQQLAKRRANVIADMLAEKGVKEGQMMVRSLGSEVPFRYDAHNLEIDRRVEIIPMELGDKEALPDFEDATTETVKVGITLSQMSRKHYGLTQYWVFIYEANRDQLPTLDSSLEPGMVLTIPDLKVRLKGLSQEQAITEALRLEAEFQAESK